MLSRTAAVITIIKCAIGAGSFSLPRAFHDGGLYFSILATLGLGLLCAYTLWLLAECSNLATAIANNRSHISGIGKSELTKSSLSTFPSGVRTFSNQHYAALGVTPHGTTQEKLYGTRPLTYPEIGSMAFPEFFINCRGRRINTVYAIVTCSIVLTSLGVCAAYVDFISGTIPAVFSSLSGKPHGTWVTQWVTICFLLPVMLMLSYLRTLKLLSWTSAVGNFAVVAGCIAVIIYGFLTYGKNITLEHDVIEWRTLPRYIGSTSFLFAIHIVILPILQQMEDSPSGSTSSDRANNERWVITASYSFVTLFNVAFGALGLILFSSSTCSTMTITGSYNVTDGPCDNVLSNISKGGVLDAIKLLVCVDLLFTIPMVLAAAREIVENILLSIFVPSSTTVNHSANVSPMPPADTRSDHTEKQVTAVSAADLPPPRQSGFNSRVSRLRANTVDPPSKNVSSASAAAAAVAVARSAPSANSLAAPHHNGRGDAANAVGDDNQYHIGECDRDIDGVGGCRLVVENALLGGGDNEDEDEDEKLSAAVMHGERLLGMGRFLVPSDDIDDEWAREIDPDIMCGSPSPGQTWGMQWLSTNDLSAHAVLGEPAGAGAVEEFKDVEMSNSSPRHQQDELHTHSTTQHAHGHTHGHSESNASLCIRFTVRTSLVFLVVLIAVGVPRFGDIVNLVGGFVCCLTGYVLPPAIYMRLRYFAEMSTNNSSGMMPVNSGEQIDDNKFHGDSSTVTTSSASSDKSESTVKRASHISAIRNPMIANSNIEDGMATAADETSRIGTMSHFDGGSRNSGPRMSNNPTVASSSRRVNLRVHSRGHHHHRVASRITSNAPVSVSVPVPGTRIVIQALSWVNAGHVLIILFGAFAMILSTALTLSSLGK